MPVEWRSVGVPLTLRREMDREEYKDKRDEERARKCEKALCVKEAFA
jgi:hypothetical protein